MAHFYLALGVELAPRDNPSLGIGVIKLVVESETAAVRTAQTLIERTREEITDQSSQRQLIDLIESIIIYKFPQKSREEIEAMFGLSSRVGLIDESTLL